MRACEACRISECMSSVHMCAYVATCLHGAWCMGSLFACLCLISSRSASRCCADSFSCASWLTSLNFSADIWFTSIRIWFTYSPPPHTRPYLLAIPACGNSHVGHEGRDGHTASAFSLSHLARSAIISLCQPSTHSLTDPSPYVLNRPIHCRAKSSSAPRPTTTRGHTAGQATPTPTPHPLKPVSAYPPQPTHNTPIDAPWPPLPHTPAPQTGQGTSWGRYK